MGPLARYFDWLHGRWPAGAVERLPLVAADGATNVPGLYVVGDLTGVPLLKLAVRSGVDAVRAIAADRPAAADAEGLELAIVGAGVAGCAAALEARARGMRFALYEAAAPFATIAAFPVGKPIYTYPTDMELDGGLRLDPSCDVKETLLADLRAQIAAAGIEPIPARVHAVARAAGGLELRLADGATVRARRVIVAIGRSGDFRRLGVPGEERGKVSNRLHDPAAFRGQEVLVVGGGDSAAEAALALAAAGAVVTLSYRKPALTRPGAANLAALELAAGRGELTLLLGSRVRAIGAERVELELADGSTRALQNQAVFALIGREPPLDFLRRSGVRITGEWRWLTWVGLVLFLAGCCWLYHWKKKYDWAFGDAVDPARLWDAIAALPGALGRAAADPATLLGTLRISASSPGFYYTLAYSVVILVFGVRRIRRRRTPYVKWQTLALMAFQWLPLFLLPEIILPYLGHSGLFDSGAAGWLANELFPEVTYGHGREYWRAYGFVLAWPLFFANVFSGEPHALWLVISCAQTFVIIPLLVWRFGKGAYCGWICSCGALAETLGDTHRHKMPHGARWNRLNLAGQVFLAVVIVAAALRVISWLSASGAGRGAYDLILRGTAGFGGWPAALRWLETPLLYLNYSWFVDLLLAGIVGVGLYFHFSGRVWCRFACPLAALMHVYARLSRFRILADKKRCISCNVCTAICHQGIDVMGFARQGRPMEDPQCVRCSACVHSCPTGVLSFGAVDRRTGRVLATDRLAASPVRTREADGG